MCHLAHIVMRVGRGAEVATVSRTSGMRAKFMSEMLFVPPRSCDIAACKIEPNKDCRERHCMIPRI